MASRWPFFSTSHVNWSAPVQRTRPTAATSEETDDVQVNSAIPLIWSKVTRRLSKEDACSHTSANPGSGGCRRVFLARGWSGWSKSGMAVTLQLSRMTNRSPAPFAYAACVRLTISGGERSHLNSKVFPSCWRRISVSLNTLGNMLGSASSNQAPLFILPIWVAKKFQG